MSALIKPHRSELHKAWVEIIFVGFHVLQSFLTNIGKLLIEPGGKTTSECRILMDMVFSVMLFGFKSAPYIYYYTGFLHFLLLERGESKYLRISEVQ